MHGLASNISGLLALLLGLAVFLKSHGSHERKVFSLLCLTMFIWLFGYGLMETSTNYQRALFFARLGHSGVLFVPTVYLHFTRYLLKIPRLALLYRWWYVLDVASLYLMYSTGLFIPTVIQQSWGFYPVGGICMLIEAVLVSTVAMVCWVFFITACRKAKLTEAFHEYNRLKYCCIALTVFSLGALDYLPKFGIRYYPLGFATNAFFVSLITYAILVHRLMDMNIVIKKSLVYSVLVGIIAGIYFSFVLLTEKLLQGIMGYRSLIGSLVAGFAIALGFNPLKDLIQRFIDRLFFHGTQVALAEENDRLRQEVARSEKLKAVATLAAGMAHEIKNPLASIKTFAEYLPEKFDDPAYREKFSRIMSQEVDRMNTLVHRLLEFARPAQPELGPVRCSELIKETLDFLQGTLLQKRITVEMRFKGKDEVLADPMQMKQVFLNLLLNSVEAIDPPGKIVMSTTQHNGHVQIAVADSGHGIAKKDLQRVFDPFFTTKSGGTGLGLSVVHSIVREHQGRVAVDSALGKGTTVTITLPVGTRPQTSDSRHQEMERRPQISENGKAD